MRRLLVLSFVLAPWRRHGPLAARPAQPGLARRHRVRVLGGLRLTTATGDPSRAAWHQAAGELRARSQRRRRNFPTPVPPGQEDLTATGGAAIPGAPLRFHPPVRARHRHDARDGRPPLVGVRRRRGHDLRRRPLTPRARVAFGEDRSRSTPTRSLLEVIANAGSSTCPRSTSTGSPPRDRQRLRRAPRFQHEPISSTGGRDSRGAAAMVDPAATTIGQTCPATSASSTSRIQLHLVASRRRVDGSVVGASTSRRSADALANGDVRPPDECGGGGVVAPASPGRDRSQARAAHPGGAGSVIGSDNSTRYDRVERDDTPLQSSSVRSS